MYKGSKYHYEMKQELKGSNSIVWECKNRGSKVMRMKCERDDWDKRKSEESEYSGIIEVPKGKDEIESILLIMKENSNLYIRNLSLFHTTIAALTGENRIRV